MGRFKDALQATNAQFEREASVDLHPENYGPYVDQASEIIKNARKADYRATAIGFVAAGALFVGVYFGNPEAENRGEAASVGACLVAFAGMQVGEHKRAQSKLPLHDLKQQANEATVKLQQNVQKFDS